MHAGADRESHRPRPRGRSSDVVSARRASGFPAPGTWRPFEFEPRQSRRNRHPRRVRPAGGSGGGRPSPHATKRLEGHDVLFVKAGTRLNHQVVDQPVAIIIARDIERVAVGPWPEKTAFGSPLTCADLDITPIRRRSVTVSASSIRGRTADRIERRRTDTGSCPEVRRRLQPTTDYSSATTTPRTGHGQLSF